MPTNPPSPVAPVGTPTDAERFAWLASRNWMADWAYDIGEDEPATVLVCEMPKGMRFGFDLRDNIDRAMEVERAAPPASREGGA